jgi:hypothetical protein
MVMRDQLDTAYKGLQVRNKTRGPQEAPVRVECDSGPFLSLSSPRYVPFLPVSAYFPLLKMEAIGFSDIFIMAYQTILRHMPDGSNLHKYNFHELI